MHLLGLEVYITCQGKQLTEYDVKSEGPNTIACYIPSAAGEKFEINMRYLKSTGHGMSFNVRIDGRSGGGTFLCSAGLQTCRTGARSSPTTRHPYIFSELQTTDDDSLAAGDGGDVGVLSVSTHRARKLRGTSALVLGPNFIRGQGAVHERSKKAGTHCIALGQGERCNPTGAVVTDKLDSRKNPYAMFVFRYRPEGLLRAQGIITEQDISVYDSSRNRNDRRTGRHAGPAEEPRELVNPNPSRVDVKPRITTPIEVEDLDSLEAELEALQRRVDMARVAGGGSVRVVKREEKPLVIMGGSAEVIDLTLDD